MAFRRTFSEILDQLQAALDHYLNFHNRERARQGYRTKERPRQRPLSDGLALRPHREAA